MYGGVEHLWSAVAQVGLESGRHAGDAADVGGHGQGEAVQGAGAGKYRGKGRHQTNRYNSKTTGDFRYS